jgi:hypothetical protein
VVGFRKVHEALSQAAANLSGGSAYQAGLSAGRADAAVRAPAD